MSPGTRTARPVIIRVVVVLLSLYAVVILARYLGRPGSSLGRGALPVSGLAFVFAVAIWHGLRWGWIGAVALTFMMLTWMATAMLIAMPDEKTVVLDLTLLPLFVARTTLEVCLLILLLLPSVRRRFRPGPTRP